MKKRTIEREVYISDECKSSLINGLFINNGIMSFPVEYFKHKAKLVIEVEEPSLTFERIRKECVPMKHLLVNKDEGKRLYLGFTRQGKLVTDSLIAYSSVSWCEKDIKDWTIEEYEDEL